MVDKGGVIAVNGVGRVEKYRFQILLDVADFRGVLFRSVYKELHADHETGAADNK